jgi:hypothetical protein
MILPSISHFIINITILNDGRRLNSEDSKKMAREYIETMKYNRIMCLPFEIHTHTTYFENLEY